MFAVYDTLPSYKTMMDREGVDGPGGLARGLLFSAGALWLGALLSWRQRALG